MARTRPFAQSYARGMIRDFPRDQLPPNAAWNLVDYLPQHGGAPARKRGGWSYASDNLQLTRAATARVETVYYAPFSAAGKLCAWDEDGEFWTIAASGAPTDVGAAFAPTGLTFHRDLLIFTGDGSAPRRYNGTALANLGGTPPTAAYAAAYKDRTVLGYTAANKNRVWFSGAGNPESWDTTNAYLDTTYPLTGIAALRNAILVFSADRIERIRGSIPPPSIDMQLEGLFDQGTSGYRSIAHHGESVIFANPSGVYMTDGAALTDLTKAGGIAQYWQSLMTSYTSNYQLSGGVYRGLYFLSVINYPSTFIDCLVCDVERRVWFRVANMPSIWFARAQGVAAEELYFACGDEARVGKISSIFSPAAAVKNDADGTAVAPVMETPFTPLQGKKRVGYIYTGHDLRADTGDTPTLTVGVVTSPEATSYTALSPTLAATTVYKRQRVPVARSVGAAGGYGFRIAQTGASVETRLYGIELQGHEHEGSHEV